MDKTLYGVSIPDTFEKDALIQNDNVFIQEGLGLGNKKTFLYSDRVTFWYINTPEELKGATVICGPRNRTAYPNINGVWDSNILNPQKDDVLTFELLKSAKIYYSVEAITKDYYLAAPWLSNNDFRLSPLRLPILLLTQTAV
jgi:hypothetical protein